MRRTLTSLSLAGLLLPAAIGQDAGQLRKRFDLFRLFNACRPMLLEVEVLDDDCGGHRPN